MPVPVGSRILPDVRSGAPAGTISPCRSVVTGTYGLSTPLILIAGIDQTKTLGYELRKLMKLELSADRAYPARTTVFCVSRYVIPRRGRNLPLVVAPVSCGVLP